MALETDRCSPSSGASPGPDSSPGPGCISSKSPTPPLAFSVSNILRQDFGREAVISTKQVIRRQVTPICRLFRPHEVQSKEKTPPTSPVAVATPAPAAATATSGGEDSKTDLWPAWVYCTRYSDRPSSGPRSRRVKRPSKSDKGGEKSGGSGGGSGGGGGGGGGDEKRPRTAFSGEQLARLKLEFAESRYLTERRRQQLAAELRLHEAQIKIWFQNKRAKIKKASGHKNPLALQLMAQGLYNHSTVPMDEEEEQALLLANQQAVSKQAAA